MTTAEPPGGGRGCPFYNYIMNNRRKSQRYQHMRRVEGADVDDDSEEDLA
eukprot:SAG25_NODE_247_length_11077_cov_5.635088_3_plen_50_part_00